MSTYSNHYSDGGFWEKVKRFGKKAGVTVLRPAFELYYSIKSEETPMWAAVTSIGRYVTKEIKEEAKEAAEDIFS